MDEPAANQPHSPGVSSAAAAHDSMGSTAPRPEIPPPPTIWPFVTAVGLAFCFWGVLLNLLVVCVGAGVFLIGMSGLIGDWVREHRSQSI